MVGIFAISKAGHDRGKWYLVLREEEEFVYLVDGKRRTTGHPKKKRKKHIQPVTSGADAALAEKIRNMQPVKNEEIKYAIKCRCKEVTHVES